MSLKTVCRLCLAMHVPVHNIVDSPLQGVYEKLSNISLNTAGPSMACYLCYSLLRKCHNLMIRSVRADKVLTQILQGGRLEEHFSEFVAVIKQYQLDDGLCVTPIERISITGTEYSLINEKMKEECLLSSQSRGEMDTNRIPLVDRFKFEDSDHEETIESPALEDMYDTESGELINEGNVKQEASDGAVDIERQELITEENIKNELEEMEDLYTGVVVIHEESTMQEELEGAQVDEDMKAEGAAPAEECKETHADKIQDRRVITSDGNNVLEHPRMCRAVIQEETTNRNVSSYTLRSIKKPANNRQDSINTSMYSDTVINKTNVSVNSDRECASTDTNVGNSNSKQLKMVVCNYIDDMFHNKYRLTKHIERHKDVKKDGNRETRSTKNFFASKGLRRSTKEGYSNRTGEKPFECDVCKVGFSWKSQLKTHLMTHTGQKPFQCDICKKRFSRKGTLKTHLMKHTSHKPFQCDICKNRFSQKGTLKTHLMKHTGHKPFQCDICKKRFSRKAHLNLHLMTPTGQKPFQCDICKNRFSQKGTLKTHLMDHTGHKPFQCDICKKRFSRKHHLNLHLITHTGQKSFQCDICNVRFSHKSTLKNHLMTHTVGQKPFPCEICKIRFSYKYTLKNHLMTHTGQKPFQCDICKNRFSYKYTLKNHLMIHTGQKPFQCEICNVTFSRKSTLKNHLMTHIAGQKPFQCEICKNRFSYKNTLKNHLMTHTGQKPFQCEICNIKFSYKKTLKNHLMTHTGQKPFQCEICNVTFNHKTTLKNHLMTHTGQKPFPCEICKIRFSRKFSLKRHSVTHIAKKPIPSPFYHTF